MFNFLECSGGTNVKCIAMMWRFVEAQPHTAVKSRLHGPMARVILENGVFYMYKVSVVFR